MKNNYLKVATIIVAVWFSSILSGCETLQKTGLLKNPQVRNVTVDSFSLGKGELTLGLEVFNPNSYPIPLAGFNFDFALNGTKIGAVDTNEKINLEGKKTEKISLPLKLDVSKTRNVLQKLIFKRSVEYSVKGNIKTNLVNIPYSKKDKLTISDLLHR